MEEQNALMESQIEAQLETQKRLIEQQNKLEAQAHQLKEPQPVEKSSVAAEHTSRSSAIDRLEKLGELRKSDILTEEEFQELKKEILEEL